MTVHALTPIPLAPAAASRIELLSEELGHAWDQADSAMLREWSVSTAGLFVDSLKRRAVNLASMAGRLGMAVVVETGAAIIAMRRGLFVDSSAMACLFGALVKRRGARKRQAGCHRSFEAHQRHTPGVAPASADACYGLHRCLGGRRRGRRRSRPRPDVRHRCALVLSEPFPPDGRGARDRLSVARAANRPSACAPAAAARRGLGRHRMACRGTRACCEHRLKPRAVLITCSSTRSSSRQPTRTCRYRCPCPRIRPFWALTRSERGPMLSTSRNLPDLLRLRRAPARTRNAATPRPRLQRRPRRWSSNSLLRRGRRPGSISRPHRPMRR